MVRRWQFGAATRVVGRAVGVAADLIQLEGGGGCSWCDWRTAARGWDCRRLDDGDAVVARVSCTSRVFSAVVSVDIQLLCGMKFKAGQSMSTANESLRAIRTERQIGQLC